MELKILIVSGDYIYKNEYQKAALKRNVLVDYTKTMTEAIDMLAKTAYSLMLIRSDTAEYLSGLIAMQKTRQPPVLLFTYSDPPPGNSDTIQKGMHIFYVTPYNIDYLAEATSAIARYYMNQKFKTDLVNPTIFTYNHVSLIVETYQAFYKETRLRLTKKEFDLLRLFMANKGVILTYEQIYNNVWGYDHSYESNNVLHSLVCRVRKKLKCELDSEEYIISVWEVGYKFGSNDKF